MQNLRRQPNRKARRQRLQVVERLPPMAELAIVAGESLELSDQDLTDALNALSGFTPPGELSDRLQARLLELAELVQARSDAPEPLRLACSSLDLVEARAELERRNGAGFVARVARMGKSAAAALAGVLLALLVWLFPSSAFAATAAPPKLAAGAESSHNVSRRKRRRSRHARACRGSKRLARALQTVTELQIFTPAGGQTRCCSNEFDQTLVVWLRWTLSSGRSGSSLPRFSSSHSSETGSGRERASFVKRERSLRSCWCGGAGASTSGTCRTGARTSRSNTRTAPLRRRPGSTQQTARATASAPGGAL